MKARAALVLAIALAVVAPPAQAAPRTLLAHLPSAPVEAAGDQASALDALAEYLAARLPGIDLEPKIFRRVRDARDYLDEHAEDVALVLTDASFALEGAAGLTPAYRFLLDGRPTYRRLLVVRADRGELEKLVDLRGKTLAVIEASGDDVAFVSAQVFDGALDPTDWFAAVTPEADDFAATASVLYGQADAALVAEYNPLLAKHLGRELRAVYESPELSLPVLSVRQAAFDAASREALAQALHGLPSDPLGRQVLAELGIEGMVPVDGAALAGAAERRAKTLAIASPGKPALALSPPPLPSPDELSYAVAVELPEIPLGVAGDEPR